MMELRQLRAFLVLAEELHFGRTAARLRVAQSAVSYALKGLESELGVELVTRSKRKVALTSAGESFRIHAAQSLQGLERAAVRARRAAQGEEGSLSLRFSFMAGLTILPRAIARFQRRYPTVELRIEPGGTVGQLDAIRTGRCDIGFMAFQRDIAPLATELVQGAPLVVLLPADHSLARRKRVEFAALATERFVFLKNASEPELHARFRGRCAAAGFEPNIVFEIEHIEALLALIAAGVGVACVPGFVRALAFPGVALRPIQPEIPTGISAVWDPRRESMATRNFLTILGEERRALPAPWAPAGLKSRPSPGLGGGSPPMPSGRGSALDEGGAERVSTAHKALGYVSGSSPSSARPGRPRPTRR